MHTAAAPRVRLQDEALYADVATKSSVPSRASRARRRARPTRRRTDRRPRPRFCEDPGADDRAPRRRRPPARARPADPDGDLAQGLHWRPDRPRAARAATPARSARSPTGSSTAHRSSAPRRRCGRRLPEGSGALAEGGGDLPACASPTSCDTSRHRAEAPTVRALGLPQRVPAAADAGDAYRPPQTKGRTNGCT